MESIQEKLKILRAQIKKCDSAVIGFSGGVDSTLLTQIAFEELGDRVLAVIGSSATLPQKEQAEAVALAQKIGVNYRVIPTAETDDLKFKSNPVDRCYYCKTELFCKLQEIAHNGSYACVFDGTNHDDLSDFRPGLRANAEQHVVSPLKNAGFSKDDIRAVAKFIGLPNWDKPATPCLSSRFPYGRPIEKKSLLQVEQAEAFLHELGFHECRVRHFDKTAKIEVPSHKLPGLVTPQNQQRIIEKLQALGYVYVTVDLAGFTSGSMNKVLPRRNGQTGS